MYEYPTVNKQGNLGHPLMRRDCAGPVRYAGGVGGRVVVSGGGVHGAPAEAAPWGWDRGWNGFAKCRREPMLRDDRDGMTTRVRNFDGRWWNRLLWVVVMAGVAAVAWVYWGRWRPPGPPAEKVVSERTRAAVREEARRKDREEIIAPGLRQPVTAENHEAWTRVLGTMKWTNYQGADSLGPLRAMLRETGWPEETRRLLLETCYAVQPEALAAEMAVLAGTETDPRLWAMAAAYGRRATGKPAALPAQATEAFRNDPRILAVLAEDREPRAVLAQRTPPLADLLTWDFGGRPVVFSFQRADRDFPGRAAVRRGDGSWLRSEGGAVWTVRQFARSVSNLPGTITNGNTPAGVMGDRKSVV